MSNPWKGLEAPDKDLQCLLGFLEAQGIKEMYEFGSGKSTEVFARAGIKVISYETVDTYAADVVRYIEGLGLEVVPEIRVYVSDKSFLEVAQSLPKLPICFVDGPRGVKSMSRIISLRAAARMTDSILLHDAQRVGEQESIAYMKSKGWSVSYLPGAKRRKKIALLRRS